MIDRAHLTKSIADVLDAVERIRQVVPSELQAFLVDRTAREVVVLNLFAALQQYIAGALQRDRLRDHA